MKIANYNDMMAYLTQPDIDILPRPKPQELLDLQEQNRKDRLRETMETLDPVLMDESKEFIEREELKFGGIPLTEEQVQAILDSYNDYKKQKGALPNLTNVVDNFTAEQKKILGKAGNIYRVKKVLKENKLKYNPKPSAEKRKAADEVRVQKVKEQKNPFLTDKKLEEKFIKDVEKRYSYPFNSSAAKKAGVLTDEQMMKKYGFGNRKLNRYIAEYRDKLNLSYPKQTYEGEKAITEERLKRKKELRKEVSGFKEEQKITDIKRPFDTGRKSYKGIDLAHKASLEQFKDLGLEYGVTNLGLDKQKLNQQIIRPTEEKMESLHKQRMELIKNVEAGKVPKDIQKQLEQINIKMSNLSMGSKGMLQAVLIDEKTLKPFVFNKDYSRIIGQGLIDKPVKELTKAELDLIKVQMPELVKTTKRKLNLELDKKSRVVKIPTAEDNKNIAKKLASLGFKCSAAEGGACDNPMAYLDSIKEQEMRIKAKAPGSEKALRAVKAGKAIFKEVLGPAALGFELAAAVPITYLGYKAGLPPQRILADATYGLLGQTEKRRVLDEAVKAGIDTTDIKRMQDFYDKAEKFKSTAIMEGTLMSPDDEMQYPDQYAKAEEDFFETIGKFEGDEERFLKAQSDLADIQQNIAQQNIKAAQERSDYLKQGMFNFSEVDDALAYMANGGRIGFADGPEDPSKRTFLKIMGGLASLPVVGKFFKAAKTAKVAKLANTTTTMPEWFPAFIDKAFEKGIAKRIDADITEVEIPELPNVKVRQYDDGRIEVEGKNGYGEPYEIDYTPPGYTIVDESTGQAVPTPGEFQANDTIYRRVGPEGDDFDVDFEVVDDVEQILGGDSTKLESFAKGTKEDKYTIGQRKLDEADAQLTRADVDEGPDIDLSDYED